MYCKGKKTYTSTTARTYVVAKQDTRSSSGSGSIQNTERGVILVVYAAELVTVQPTGNKMEFYSLPLSILLVPWSIWMGRKYTLCVGCQLSVFTDMLVTLAVHARHSGCSCSTNTQTVAPVVDLSICTLT